MWTAGFPGLNLSDCRSRIITSAFTQACANPLGNGGNSSKAMFDFSFFRQPFCLPPWFRRDRNGSNLQPEGTEEISIKYQTSVENTLDSLFFYSFPKPWLNRSHCTSQRLKRSSHYDQTHSNCTQLFVCLQCAASCQVNSRAEGF